MATTRTSGAGAPVLDPADDAAELTEALFRSGDAAAGAAACGGAEEAGAYPVCGENAGAAAGVGAGVARGGGSGGGGGGGGTEQLE